MEDVLSKKEQITKALRNTELMLTKHSDKYVPLFYYIFFQIGHKQ